MIATFSLSKHVSDNVEYRPSTRSVSINLTDGSQRVSLVWESQERFVEWVNSLSIRSDKMGLTRANNIHLPDIQTATPMPSEKTSTEAEYIDTNAPCRT